jgi:hypothetical protein
LELLDYNNILIELNKAVKMHNFYPKGHPSLDLALNNCFKLIEKGVNEYGELTLTLDPKGFYADGNPITPNNEELSSLAKKFFYRRVKELTFTQRLNTKELKGLLNLLSIEADELQLQGGAEAFFAAQDVSGILLNEMRYEELLRLKKELEAKAEEEKLLAADGEESPPPGEEEQQPEPEPEPEPEPAPPEELAEEEEQFKILLDKLDKETDFLRYNDISVRILTISITLVKGNRFDELLPVILAFYRHSTPASGLHMDLRTVALERLDTLLKYDETLKYLIHKVGNKIEQNREIIQRLILRCEERAIQLLLNALIDAQEASRRRNIFNSAILFGKKLLPLIHKELDNERWYAVRQMVALLGELGDSSTIDFLEYAYANDDLRVKKEVLKSLARIQGPVSTAFLLRALDEEDQSLVIQAIISLGMLRDPSVIDKIGELALKWRPFSDNQDSMREAIKAMGIIGDMRAVPYLTKVLLNTRWFNRQVYESARSLAASSLGMIGSEEAYTAIEKVRTNSTGDLYNICKRILDGKETSDESN